MNLNKRRSKKDKMVNDLKRILNAHQEKNPTTTGWKREGNVMVKEAKLRYEIDRRLLNQMEKYTELYINIPDADMHDIATNDFKNVAIIYYANSVDKDVDEFFVGYTCSYLHKFIKINIHKHNMGEKNVFENFENTDDLVNIIFIGLEYVKFKYVDDLEDRVTTLKAKIAKLREQQMAIDQVLSKNKQSLVGGKTGKTVKTVKTAKAIQATNPKLDKPVSKEEKIFEKRMEFVDEVLSKSMHHFKPFDGCVYQVMNKETGKSFIGGDEKDIDKKTFLKKLERKDNSDLIKDVHKYGADKFEFKKLETFHAKTPYHLTFRIDFLKKINNTVYGGYNLGYGLEYSDKLFQEKLLSRDKNYIQRDMFLKLQKHLFIKNYNDTNDYKGVFGYVYKIENKGNDKKYFGSTFNSQLKDIIVGMYDKAIEGNVKHNKILKVFMEEPYDQFIFEIVKTKGEDDTRVDLNDEAENLIRKYNTIETGYNIDINVLKKNIMIGRQYH